jgi:hypothetical protein
MITSRSVRRVTTGQSAQQRRIDGCPQLDRTVCKYKRTMGRSEPVLGIGVIEAGMRVRRGRDQTSFRAISVPLMSLRTQRGYCDGRREESVGSMWVA